MPPSTPKNGGRMTPEKYLTNQENCWIMDILHIENICAVVFRRLIAGGVSKRWVLMVRPR